MPDVNITIRTIDESERGTKRTVGSLTELASAIAIARQAYALLDQGFNATVGELDNYASQVERVSRLTGESVEESSRLIQVADDLFISYESLSSALTIASKQTDTSIDGIAKLSDQYLALEGAQARNEFAAKNFGRQYGEVIKLLEAGGDTIRRMATETPEGLILKDEDIEQIRAYRREIDAASDSWQAFKLQAGGEILDIFNEQAVRMNAANILMEDGNEFLAAKIVKNQLLTQSEQDLFDAAMATAEAQYYQNENMDDAALKAEELEVQLQALSETNETLLEVMRDFQGVADSYNEKTTDLKKEAAELLEQKQLLISQGYSAEGEKIQDINDRLKENSDAQLAAAAAAEEASKRRIIALLETKFMSDKVLSEDEFNALLALEEQWGLMSSEAVTAAQEVNSAVDQYLQSGDLDGFASSVEDITAALLGLPEVEKTIKVNIVTTVNGQPGTIDDVYADIEQKAEP